LSLVKDLAEWNDRIE